MLVSKLTPFSFVAQYEFSLVDSSTIISMFVVPRAFAPKQSESMNALELRWLLSHWVFPEGLVKTTRTAQYAAVAAKISCLFAVVQVEQSNAKKVVKSRVTEFCT